MARTYRDKASALSALVPEMTTCSPGLTPESSTVCPSTEPPPDPPSVTPRIAYPPPVATKTIVLSPIMAIAPGGTLTAPSGAGPDSDMLVPRPATMPGPATISAFSTPEPVAGSLVHTTTLPRTALSGETNTVMP